VVEVEVTTNGWPINAYKPEDITADPSLQAEQNANQAYMDANPGVTIKFLDVPVWDPQAIQANVAGGTDCTYLFGPCVGGGWGREQAVNAFVQGLLADISAEVVKYKLQQKCVDYLWTNWSANSSVEGKYWSYPLNEYSPSANCMMYRKDWITEKGLKMPSIGWTWDEAVELWKGLTDKAKGVSGIGYPSWFLGSALGMHGFDLLSQAPQPSEPWHWTRDLTSDSRWTEIAKQYRQMVHTDKVIYTDVALGGGMEQYQNLFLNGTTGFTQTNYWNMFGGTNDATSLATMAKNAGKKYEDMFGVVIHPRGDGYQQSGGVNTWGPVSISPNATPEQKDKGVGWVDFRFFGEGLIIARKGKWDITKDPSVVFNAFLFLDGRVATYEGVPGSAVDAWGKDVVDTWTNVGKLPYEHQRDEFFPAEKNPAPTNQAIDDAFSLMVADPKDMDVGAVLKKAETDWKAQLGGFSSSVTTDEFKAAAVKYYAALDEFLKKNYPEFYANRFKPFYEAKVLPAIG
jgi:hypothetical protein